jgi:CheY-like chemotaxis protein
LVEDNEDAAEMLASLLELDGHQVRVARDGIEALSLLRDSLPEVILLDIGLPGMDGYEVARRVRLQTGPQAPMMIALTGYGQESDRAQAQRQGSITTWSSLSTSSGWSSSSTESGREVWTLGGPGVRRAEQNDEACRAPRVAVPPGSC